MKTAIVLFNLGGPDNTAAVEPFLFNLFHDPAIIGVPQPMRWLIAKFISGRRAPVAQKIYDQIGGSSPILAKTEDQAQALESMLTDEVDEYRTFIAMRYWHPLSGKAARDIKAWGADRVILLPLYPQFSTTTTGSSVKDWHRAARKIGLDVPTSTICCYFNHPDFIAGHVTNIRETLEGLAPADVRILFSAHGLPEKTVKAGDPYQWQIEQTVAAIMAEIGDSYDYVTCYQSRVGPMKWIGPATAQELDRAAVDGKNIVVVPVAFVSDHSETLVELDIQYRKRMQDAGVAIYRRVPALGTQAHFIEGLANMVRATSDPGVKTQSQHVCGPDFCKCPLL